MKTVGDIIYSDKELKPGTYFWVWLALLLLLFVTWRAAYAGLGDRNLILALFIAAAKSALVLWFFMDLRSSPKLVLLFFGLALAMLVLAALLTLADFVTRG